MFCEGLDLICCGREGDIWLCNVANGGGIGLGGTSDLLADRGFVEPKGRFVSDRLRRNDGRRDEGFLEGSVMEIICV